MKLHCQTQGCNSEEFAFSDGPVILIADGEVLCCPSEEREEFWIREIYEGLVILEWIVGIGSEWQERAIPVEEFDCLKCGGPIGFEP
jgi:hypothetical protein